MSRSTGNGRPWQPHLTAHGGRLCFSATKQQESRSLGHQNDAAKRRHKTNQFYQPATSRASVADVYLCVHELVNKHGVPLLLAFREVRRCFLRDFVHLVAAVGLHVVRGSVRKDEPGINSRKAIPSPQPRRQQETRGSHIPAGASARKRGRSQRGNVWLDRAKNRDRRGWGRVTP